jgi:predicted MFS family arabinose efflux permease
LGLEVLLGWFEPSATAILLALAVFGAVFAANSAIHSYLIVAYSDRDGVSTRVGFYYMANAAGRAVGTIVSGALYQASGAGAEGLFACVAASVILVALSAVATLRLVQAEERATAHERTGL